MFENILSIALQKPLPGKAAQILMAPTSRNLKEDKNENTKQSAVLILIVPRETKEIILIKRKVDGSVHSGQISFPGGKVETSDYSLLYTAQREAEEEIGIKPEDYKILGKLSSLYIPPSNFLVYPYVAIMYKEKEFVISEGEVDKIIKLPLRQLINPSIKKEEDIYRSDNRDLLMRAQTYKIEEHTVWGATAMMLSELEQIIVKEKINV